jgi:hypothetical protein
MAGFLTRYDNFHRLLYEKLGFDYDPRDFIPEPKLIMNTSTHLEFTHANLIAENKIATKVQEYYGDQYFKQFKRACFILDKSEPLANFYGIDLINRLNNIRDDLRKNKIGIDVLAEMAEKFSNLSLDLIPEYLEIYNKEKLALSLIAELESIGSGINDWAKYEKAQHDAYEQSGILIIIVDDDLLKKLILSKAYMGDCDDIIANEKVKFEIGY